MHLVLKYRVLYFSERCYQEIEKVLQDDELVTYDARNHMPYVQVCLKIYIFFDPEKCFTQLLQNLRWLGKEYF